MLLFTHSREVDVELRRKLNDQLDHFFVAQAVRVLSRDSHDADNSRAAKARREDERDVKRKAEEQPVNQLWPKKVKRRNEQRAAAEWRWLFWREQAITMVSGQRRQRRR